MMNKPFFSTKSAIFSALFFMFGAIPSFSQIGIKGGFQLATIKEEDENINQNDLEKHSIVGPVLGLTLDLNLSSHFSIQPEILYAQSGGRNTYNILGTQTEHTYRINYIEVPLLAKIKLGNAGDGVGIYVAAGPWIGLAMSGKNKVVTNIAGSEITREEDFTFDDKDNAERANFGIIGAAGIGIGKVSLDLRYNYGLNNLLDKDADNTNDNKPVLQTRGLALTLGYNF